MKEKYAGIVIETIRFESMDVITSSDEWEENEIHEIDRN